MTASTAKGKGKASATSSSTAKTGKEASTTGGARQLTLFGAPPPGAASKGDKASKKRKAASSSDVPTEVTAPAPSATVSSSSASKLDAFRHKPKAGTAAAAGLGGAVAARELPREGEELEETQVGETQEAEGESLVELRREENSLEAVREQTEEQESMVETQVEGTQVEDTQVEDTQVEDTQMADTQMADTQLETQPTASVSSHPPLSLSLIHI
mgnify:CR=1 FL=1